MSMKPRERQMYLPPDNNKPHAPALAPASKPDEAGGSSKAAGGSADGGSGADGGGASSGGQEGPRPPAGRRKVSCAA
jgi:hypothetical protein